MSEYEHKNERGAILSRLSPDQQEAALCVIEAVDKHRGGIFCLTGKAGTGKSYVVKIITEVLGADRVRHTASTGLAASLIGGCTLHNFAGVSPRNTKADSGKINAAMGGKILLVIDEVSMVSADLIDTVIRALRRTRTDVVVLCVGDFFQLPPVEGEPAYKSAAWSSVVMLNLTTNHRQGADKEFGEVLDMIRKGGPMPMSAARKLSSRCVKSIPEDHPCLFPYVDRAAYLNRKRLNELPGDLMRSTMVVVDNRMDWLNAEELRTYMEKNIRAPVELDLKVGARVIHLANDGVWVNGTLGRVEWMNEDSVLVRGDDNSLRYISQTRFTVQDPLGGEPLLSVLQYPLALAWALSIHKAQGQTLDKVCVDLSDNFAAGMSYVALSRCRTLDGLAIVGKLPPFIRADPETVRMFTQ